MKTSIIGHGAVENGVVQGGTVALLLGAVLAAASGGAQAAESVAVAENDVRLAQVEQAAAQREAHQAAQRAAREAAQREAREHADASAHRQEELQALDEKLRKAQERLQEAVQEVAALSQARAQDAIGGMDWLGALPGNARPLLGIQLDPDREGLKEGTRIEEVSPGGPAEQAGVRAGDVLVMVDGRDVRKQTTREVLQQLRSVQVGKPVKLRVLRDGKSMDFDVTPRMVSGFVFTPPMPPAVPMPDVEAFRDFGRFSNFGGRSALSGLEVTPLTPQLGKYFGTDKGMLVLRAPKDELYKLREGDVILSIDGRVPTSGSHISRILGSYQAGEKLTLRIMRDRKEQDLSVTVPENPRRAAVRERQRDRSSTDEL